MDGDHLKTWWGGQYEKLGQPKMGKDNAVKKAIRFVWWKAVEKRCR
ncbi:hypothetical protein N643_03905 [Salmonella bongori serovar 48:z41:-- str. RKS3044]|uniref:Uncharacterized protein n=1 Tax=Salmonella bongori N268-08 TaxID=1197719 RepID=S5MN50_SALBN|nr:hypothetical protein A464_855 [Salmonella bongori N268-08]AID27043.1 hypothetical protein N643_03905 [Salmonella bongori serovar 48:z41:-- str. RKS3044]